MSVTVEYKEGIFYIVSGTTHTRTLFPKDSQLQSAPVLMGLNYSDGTFVPIGATSDGKLNVDASIVVEDIEIGAVEIKNSTTDDRVNVESSGSKMSMYVQTEYSANKYYKNQALTALTTAYQPFALGFTSKDTIVINDSDTNYIEVSFDGTNTHWKLLDGEGFDFAKNSITTIYLRGQAGGESYRLISC